MRTLLVLAGLGQLALALASLWIPRALGWREETARLQPLTRGVFWTYAGYILANHVCFGLLSALAPDLLLAGTPLARCVSGFIAAYWGARLLIQFLVFRRSGLPPGVRFRLAEAALVSLFVYLTAVYGWVAATG
jgi:hypothetical protein